MWRKKLGFLAVPVVLLVFVFVGYQGHAWTSERIAGLVMAVAGFTCWGIAHVTLGESFAVRAEARRLITTGIYSRFRNPIYVFGSIGIAGFFLLIEQPRFLLAFILLIPLQLVRGRREARVLEEKFGDEYREYARHTWI